MPELCVATFPYCIYRFVISSFYDLCICVTTDFCMMIFFSCYPPCNNALVALQVLV